MASLPSWRSSESAAEGQRRRTAGHDLLQHLLGMYATSKITAKDFAVACFYCSEARVEGANFSQYGVAPNQSSDGNYQKAVDRAVGAWRPPLYFVPTPVQLKGKVVRSIRQIPMNPIHEAIAREVSMQPSIVDEVQRTSWPQAYWDHVVVQRARARGSPLPLPIGIYLDGVRFSAPLAGRSEATLGIWVFNCITFRRHYVIGLRTLDLCKCGCRGWCSIYPVLLAMSWSLQSLSEGRRPQVKHDGTQWLDTDPLHSIIADEGEEFGFVANLLWLKGDWGEFQHSLGLPSTTAIHSPCPMCSLRNLTHASMIDRCALLL